jgi:hypothetical protein
LESVSPNRYLDAVVREYREDCEAGFPNDFEARKKLWRAAVIVCESADYPEPWLDMLRNLSVGIIKPSGISATIRSAARKAASHA